MQEEIYTSSFSAGNKNVLHALACVNGWAHRLKHRCRMAFLITTDNENKFSWILQNPECKRAAGVKQANTWMEGLSDHMTRRSIMFCQWRGAKVKEKSWELSKYLQFWRQLGCFKVPIPYISLRVVGIKLILSSLELVEELLFNHLSLTIWAAKKHPDRQWFHDSICFCPHKQTQKFQLSSSCISCNLYSL